MLHEKIKFAKDYIRINDPFYSSLMSNITFVERPDDEMPTMATDCKRNIFYGNKFVDEQPKENIIFVTMHELCHKAYMHFLAFQTAEYPSLMNIAQDFVINNMLERSINNGNDRSKRLGKKLHLKHNNFANIVKQLKGKGDPNEKAPVAGDPLSVLIDCSLDGLSSLDIYQKLLDELKDEIDEAEAAAKVMGDILKELLGQGEPQSKGPDGEQEGLGAGKPDESQPSEATLKAEVQAAMEVAKQVGSGHNPIIQQLDKMFEPKIDWKSICRNWMTRLMEPDPDIRSPHYLSQQFGFFVPGHRDVEAGAFAFVVDQSGSMSDDDRAICLAELHGFYKDLDLERLEFICFDSDVTQHQTFESSDDFKPIFKGSGGTSIKTSMELVNTLDVDGIIVVTDGYIFDSNEVLPNCPQFWLITTDAKNFEPQSRNYLPTGMTNYSYWSVDD